MLEQTKFIKYIPQHLIEKVLGLTSELKFNQDDTIFSENDIGNAIYFIEDGSVSITANKNNSVKHIRNLYNGDCFGEMSLINNDTRSATVTALEKSTIYCLHKDDFGSLSKDHPELTDSIKSNIINRQKELFLREELLDSTGLDSKLLHISFKGDASLRETALYRERYKSTADENMHDLIKSTIDVIVNRCAYQIMINFNSGEIRTTSIFDPFREKTHTVNKFIEPAYIKRHFQEITYNEKTNLVKNIYQHITQNGSFNKLCVERKDSIVELANHWKPVDKEMLKNIINRFSYLRSVDNFYLRNVKISMIQDAVRMQFNCDGTHIIDTDNFEPFFEDNF